jgi:hypothetical protein
MAFITYMKSNHPKLAFDHLNQKIQDYFFYIQGEYHIEQKLPKNAKEDTAPENVIIYDRQPEPPTITGLALHIGFSSRQEFEEYEKKPRYAQSLKRARLKIESEYEKKLHLTSATGAIFALKSLGWNDDKETGNITLKTLDIQIIETGPQLAANEKEVAL